MQKHPFIKRLVNVIYLLGLISTFALMIFGYFEFNSKNSPQSDPNKTSNSNEIYLETSIVLCDDNSSFTLKQGNINLEFLTAKIDSEDYKIRKLCKFGVRAQEDPSFDYDLKYPVPDRRNYTIKTQTEQNKKKSNTEEKPMTKQWGKLILDEAMLLSSSLATLTFIRQILLYLFLGEKIIPAFNRRREQVNDLIK